MTAALIILTIALCAALVFIVSRLRSLENVKSQAAVNIERLASAQQELERREASLNEAYARIAALEAEVREISEKHIVSRAEANNTAALLESERTRFSNELEAERSRSESALAEEKKRNADAMALSDKRHAAEVASIEKRLAEETAAAEERQRQLLKQTEANFKVMASEIMRDQSNALTDRNRQHLGELLNPLKNDIEKFRNDVNQAYSSEARERFSLQERIKELIEANNNIGREAKELASALRGNSKTQGDWGELVLENILENSGLRKGSEFTIQETTDEQGNTLRDEQGRGLRPDVVVHYPDGRAMVIDSKVSLTAFVDFVNSEEPGERDRHGKLHLASVVKHINELSGKNYQNYVGKERLDFVMMFIPNESAYAAAMSLDPTLWQKAYDKRVLIVSPTQLVGSLRLINQLWSHDRQTRNAIEIAEKSGQMYDKFVGFVEDMERIGKAINSTQTAFEGAINKLSKGRGNLLSRAENLRKLGVKASKRLKASTENDEETDSSDEE